MGLERRGGSPGQPRAGVPTPTARHLGRGVIDADLNSRRLPQSPYGLNGV